jgi:hypothetical protein
VLLSAKGDVVSFGQVRASGFPVSVQFDQTVNFFFVGINLVSKYGDRFLRVWPGNRLGFIVFLRP